jgi:hypothetical protein
MKSSLFLSHKNSLFCYGKYTVNIFFFLQKQTWILSENFHFHSCVRCMFLWENSSLNFLLCAVYEIEAFLLFFSKVFYFPVVSWRLDVLQFSSQIKENSFKTLHKNIFIRIFFQFFLRKILSWKINTFW